MNYGMGPNFGFGPQSGGQFGGFNGYNQCAPMNFMPPNYFQPTYFPAMNWGGGFGFTPPANSWMGPAPMGWGLGGARTWGGTYTPQFMTTGLPTDQEIVEMVYDSMDDDPVIPFDADINVMSDAGTVTLTGMVPSKLVKHAAGDDAWWIPGVDDVHNDLQVMMPQRGRAGETTRGMGQQRPSTTTTRGTRAGTTTAAGTTARGTTGTSRTSGTTSRGATAGPSTRGGTASRGAKGGMTGKGGKGGTTAKGGTTGTASAGRAAPSASKQPSGASERATTGGASPTSTTGETGTRTETGTRRSAGT